MTDVALLRLRRLIDSLYDTDRELEDLSWKLTSNVEGSPDDPLDTYIRSVKPRDVLNSLVLNSRDKLERAFRHLRCDSLSLPSGRDELETAAGRILWKLGFSTPIYPSLLSDFWRLHEAFGEALGAWTSPYDSRAQEAIRGVAVNFFVALEEVLDVILSYITWALLCDHYGQPRFGRFRFIGGVARSFMVSVLNGKVIDGQPVVLREDGKNTLYPLVAGLSLLSEHCRNLLDEDETQYRRPEEARPGWVGRASLCVFPFTHTVPILDLHVRDRVALLAILDGVLPTMSKGDVLNVRNRLEHKRDPFPTREEIATALNETAACVSLMETNGICPSLYVPAETRSTVPGRMTRVLRDYRGAAIEMETPSPLSWLDIPEPDDEQLVLSCARLAGTTEPLRFHLTQESPYVEMRAAAPVSVRSLKVGDKIVDGPTNGADPSRG